MNTLDKMNRDLRALVIFRNLLDDRGIKRLAELLSAPGGTPADQANRYASFVSAVFQETGSLTDYIFQRVLEDENIYVQKRAKGQRVDGVLQQCLASELKILEQVSQLTPKQVKAYLDDDGYLPEWETNPVDFAAEYTEWIKGIGVHGYGMFSSYHMFTVKDSRLVPVKWPDRTQLSDLKGYERERSTVVGNTLALLKDKPAANVLLYGDAGTGKSSTVKAIANAYHSQGLRLIEMTKKQCGKIPDIVDKLSTNPLKFILFIDDLSFAQENDDFYALKAVLEGSVAAKTPNVVIYATSNRRHLIKESFSDREGDDVHRNETIQELCSLSRRFGLSVGFFKPNRELYLKIVHALKDQYGIKIDDGELEIQAEQFASSGRSPRVARQFMEHLKRMEE